jgi:hypothetical protein
LAGSRRACACGRALEEQLALACVPGQRGGTLELGPRLLRASELDKQIASNAWEQVVACEHGLTAQRIDVIEAGLRAFSHRDGDRPVQLDDW